MIQGYWPGASGQATKLGIWPYLVVTMTSFSYMGAVSSVRRIGAESLARLCRPVTRFDPPRRAGAGDHICQVMIRFAGLALLFSTALTAAGAAQTVAPSATPTNGAVGSAAQSNGFPASGGAVSLPGIQNAPTTASTLTTGTTATSSPTGSINSPASPTSTTTGGAGPASAASGANGGGGSGGRGGSRGGGGAAASTAGAATATGSSGTGGKFVLCPPSGAPGLEPLFTGTDLSCAPQ